MTLSEPQDPHLSEYWRAQAVAVIRIQALAALLAGIGAYFATTGLIAVSVFFGGLLVVFNSVLLGRSVAGVSASGATGDQRHLYRSAAIRFVGLILALSLGYATGLSLPAVAAGMFGAYFAGFVFIVSRAFVASKK